MPDLAALDLEAFPGAALEALAAGIAAPGHALHSLALATIGLDGAPRLRSVVPRGLDARARRLAVHTDRRSAKVAELRREPRASILGYDGEARLQIRLEGSCAVHHADEPARLAWEGLHPPARRLYRIAPAPGTAVTAEGAIEPERFDEVAAFANFALLVLTFETLDILFLGRERHRRMRADWQGGSLRLNWVVP